MPLYHCTKTMELMIEAPSAQVARQIAEDGFKQKLSPGDILPGMSMSNIQNVKVHVEKVR